MRGAGRGGNVSQANEEEEQREEDKVGYTIA